MTMCAPTRAPAMARIVAQAGKRFERKTKSILESGDSLSGLWYARTTSGAVLKLSSYIYLTTLSEACLVAPAQQIC